VGPLHVIQFSSEHDWRVGSEQYTWLEQQLKAVDRTVTPWLLVTSHRMMYSSQADRGTLPALMRENLEGLMHDYKVCSNVNMSLSPNPSFSLSSLSREALQPFPFMLLGVSGQSVFGGSPALVRAYVPRLQRHMCRGWSFGNDVHCGG